LGDTGRLCGVPHVDDDAEDTLGKGLNMFGSSALCFFDVVDDGRARLVLAGGGGGGGGACCWEDDDDDDDDDDTGAAVVDGNGLGAVPAKGDARLGEAIFEECLGGGGGSGSGSLRSLAVRTVVAHDDATDERMSPIDTDEKSDGGAPDSPADHDILPGVPSGM
jgi:hypothetical protein